jgi:predicted transcriptional regulator
MAETTFTFRVDRNLKGAFNNAAEIQDRSGSQLLRDFMRDFVKRTAGERDYEAWFHEKVAEGVADARAGRVVSGKQVEAHFAVRRAAALKKAGKHSG